MNELRRDLGHSVRSLARRPAFLAVVVTTLALGIGATTAIFSVVNAVLLKPLPYRAPDRLALIWSRWTNFEQTWLSAAEFLDYQRLNAQFEDAAAWSTGGEVALTSEGDAPESVNAATITANLPAVLGVSMASGRSFTPEEDVPNGPEVTIIGHDLWRRRYGGEPLVGRTIEVDGRSREVVGILPASFRLPLEFQSGSRAQVIMPLRLDRSAPNRGSHGLYGVGRMQPGVEPARVSAELAALARRWTTDGLYPESMQFTAFATGLVDEVRGGISTALTVLSVAVLLLLLLTAANVANLILTRGEGRSRELALRSALGANRWHVIRVGLTESLVLGVSGGVLGLLLAWAGVRILVSRAPTTIPRLDELSVDLSVAGFALVLSMVTGLLVGLVPAIRGARVNLADSLRDGSRAQSGALAGRHGRTALVVAEMALAVLLVIGAGLTIRSFRNLMAISPGFEATNVLTLRLSLPSSRYPEASRVVRFYDALADEIRAMPGVRAAGYVRLLPLASEIGDAGTQIEGRPVPPGEPGRSADWQAVTPGYLEAMRTPIVRGRDLGPQDTPDGEQVILINETLAREYFPGENPLGQRIRIFGGSASPWRTIIGVTADVHHNSLLMPVKRAWFVPLNQWSNSAGGATRRAMTLVIRTSGNPRGLILPVEEALRRMDPALPMTQITTLEAVLASATREQRFTTALMSGFAALALVLAAVGIFGVISYAVSQRTREIGIRMALGADVGSVRALVLRQGMAPAATGIALGVASAVLLTRFLRTLLHGVAPIDPPTFVAMPALLLVVAAGSVMIPAVRASRVQPVEALREE
ncbi:MAG TPA: ABC transporter permease [Gemmatimonadaceae bacterium]